MIQERRKSLRHKRPDKELLAGSQSFVNDVVIADPEAVSGYLREVDIGEYISDEKLIKMYRHIRKRLTNNLEGKAAEDPVLAAFIERIARTGVILQEIEQRALNAATIMSKDEREFYIKQQKEHASCLEKFKNILFVEHRKIKATVLDELAEEIHGGKTRKTVKKLEIDK